MAARRTVVLFVAFSLLVPALLGGAQAQNNSTDDEEVQEEESSSEAWLDCWEDEYGASCEAVASTSEEARQLYDEAEADGRLPFSLDDPNVNCHEETWEDEVALRCYEEDEPDRQQTHVECWEDREGPTCEAVAASRDEARQAFDDAEAAGELPFRMDDPYTDCHTESWDGEVRMMCTRVDSLVECWDDHEGPVCEAWGQTREEAREKLEREADQLPFDLDAPNVVCEEERHDGEVTLFCFEEPERQEHDQRDREEYDERTYEAPRDDHDEPHAQPDCTPRPEEGVVECTAPPGCEDGRGERCPVPPECEFVDRDRVACPMDAASQSGSHGSSPQPDCRPADADPNAMVCTPPPECRDQLGQTPACTPPPECEERGDGTFLCSFDRTREHGEPGRDASTDRRQPHVGETVREDLSEAIGEALSQFRSSLDELRDEYEQGKADLAERYEQAKDELREEYRACLGELADDAERVEALEHELACKQEARAALQEERAVLLAERDLLREDLLSQAQTQQFSTCQNLQETLHGILVDAGVFEADLAAHLAPGDLGLCASILLDGEVAAGRADATGGGLP